VAAPAIGVEFLILIGKRWFKGATMQIQFDHISSREGLLWQVAEKEFVDHTRPRDANGTLLLGSLMSGHDHTAGDAFSPYRHFGTIVEVASHLAFWTLLQLIGR